MHEPDHRKHAVGHAVPLPLPSAKDQMWLAML